MGKTEIQWTCLCPTNNLYLDKNKVQTMAQTKQGAVKAFCKQHNISVTEYNSKINSGLKWCTGCKGWHDRNNFGEDNTRIDKLASSCLMFRRGRYKIQYQKKIFRTTFKGSRFVEARDGDKKQARRRVNHLVVIGALPNPNKLPCSDCGHIYKADERRHEYDHYLGYGKYEQEIVEAVCTICHKKRERARNAKN